MKAAFIKKLDENRPICGPTAITLITGVSFNKVWDTVKTKWSMHKNWKGAMHTNQIVGTLRNPFKFSVRKVFAPEKGTRVSVQKWALTQAKSDVTYLVLTIDHVAVVRNGKMYDQTGGVNVSKAHHRLKIIDTVYKVEKKNEEKA